MNKFAICRDNGWDEEEVAHHLAELQTRGLVKAMEHGAFTRQQSMDTQVTVVKQMPTMVSSKQPTIAIITAQYCEKLAVDAMIENKETFVRYTTVGKLFYYLHFCITRMICKIYNVIKKKIYLVKLQNYTKQKKKKQN